MKGFLKGKRLRVEPDCYPCFLRQCVIALELSGTNSTQWEGVMKAALAVVHSTDHDKSPAHATTPMHRKLRELLGDPYAEIKLTYNEKALSLYPELKRTVKGSREPLFTAARLAIAGNVIDFGIFDEIDVEGTVLRALEGPMAVEEAEEFSDAVAGAEDIMYLLDNAGEVVFDRLLIEELLGMGKEVTAVVKAEPVINDCTMEDAGQAGLAGICRLIDNGSDAVGTILETTSESFRREFEQASLVISKGQGNFETLLEHANGSGPVLSNIFFLFQSKCPVLSRELGLAKGSMLLVGSDT